MVGLATASDDDSRERLIRTAGQIFAHQPYDSVSLVDIAMIAGVALHQVGDHFPDKQDLYLAQLSRSVEALVTHTGPAQGDAVGPVVRSGLQSHLDFAEANPAIYKPLIEGGPGIEAEARALVRWVEDAFTSRILKLLGVTRPSPQILVEMAGWMAFVQRTTSRWLDHPGLDSEELLAIQLRHLMNALRIGGAAS